MSRSALTLLAFASGTIVPIEAVPDPVFSQRMLGDGIAIRPDHGLVIAPCAGTVIQVHRAGHACIPFGVLEAWAVRVDPACQPSACRPCRAFAPTAFRGSRLRPLEQYHPSTTFCEGDENAGKPS